jgi:ADP-heptose:LPS heptosyltransferase
MRKAQKILHAEIYFVSFRRVGGSLDLLGTVPRANVFTLRDDSLWHLAIDTFAFLIWTRRKNIDTVIDLELFSRFTALLTGFSGADRRVGFHRIHNEGLYRGSMLSHRVAYNPHIHIAKNFIAMVDALLVAEPTQYYAKTVIGDDEIALAQCGRPTPPATPSPRASANACRAMRAMPSVLC